MDTIQLTEKGAQAVLDTLENPPPVTGKLRAAADAYKRGSKWLGLGKKDHGVELADNLQKI